MSKVIVGIDPGQKGAIAVIDNGNLQVYDLKVCIKPTGSFNSLDPSLFYVFVKKHVPHVLNDVVVFCEESQTHKIAGTTSIKTARAIFDARGVMRTVLQLQGFEVRYIQPQTWKRELGLLKQDKFASVEKAKQLFPESKDIFEKQHGTRNIPLDGRAEASLIAHYGFLVDSIRKAQ